MEKAHILTDKFFFGISQKLKKIKNVSHTSNILYIMIFMVTIELW
jgi:hypothetical protein